MLKKARKSPRKILLVDHEDSIREIFRSVLEGAGYKVSTARNREEALKKIDKKLPDLIISEAELPPIKSGFHFYKHLKSDEKTKNIPFIFLTAVDTTIVSKILKDKDIHIAKPIKSQDFLQKTEQFLQKHVATNVVAKKQRIKKSSLDKSVIQILDFSIEKQPIPPKEKNNGYPIIPLPPGDSTKFFSTPSAVFDIKMLKIIVTKTMKAFKSGNFIFKDSEMLFPFLSDQSPPKRLVPINLPQLPEIVDIGIEEITADLEMIETGTLSVDFFETANDSASNILDNNQNNDMRNVFLQHFNTRGYDFHLGIFDHILVLDDHYSMMYYDDEFEEISLYLLQQNFEEFFSSLRSLSTELDVKGNTSYLWLETEDQSFLLVNSPEKKILSFAGVQDAPIEAIFKDELSKPEFLENETFFLLPSLSCSIPIITQNKAQDLLSSMLSNFSVVIEGETFIQKSNDGTLIAATKESTVEDKVHQCTHNVFSVAGLCFQICEMGFHLDYIMLEGDETFLFANDTNKEIFVSCLKVKAKI